MHVDAAPERGHSCPQQCPGSLPAQVSVSTPGAGRFVAAGWKTRAPGGVRMRLRLSLLRGKINQIRGEEK